MRKGVTYLYLGLIFFKLIALMATLAGLISCWWRDKLGGWLHIAAYLLWILWPTLYHGIYLRDRFEFDPHLILFFIPYLIVGILFLVAARLSSKRTF
jgi:hypothetical protein